MPRLGRHVLPQDAPVHLSRFAARFRSVFEAELNVPKPFDVDKQFGAVADNLHVNARDPQTETWRFQRFAPAWATRLGRDLTGENVLHPSYAPYNTRLDDQLRQVVEREMPFYTATYVEGPNGAELVHRLLIPMSTNGNAVTHCLVFTFAIRVAAPGHFRCESFLVVRSFVLSAAARLLTSGEHPCRRKPSLLLLPLLF